MLVTGLREEEDFILSTFLSYMQMFIHKVF